MSGIFVSYRRGGGVRTHTYRLVDELRRQFGDDQVFLDVKSIDPGVRYADAIRDAIRSCSVVLVIIGPRWLELEDEEGQRRLDNSEDVLRIEVETALAAQARVIPVLLDGAVMPRPQDLPEGLRELTELQAFSLAESHWDYDTGKLTERLQTLIGTKRAPRPSGPAPFSGKVIAGALLVAMVTLAYAADEITDRDAAIGGLAFALVGVLLCGLGLKDIRDHEARGRVTAIVSLVFGTLMSLALLGEWEDLPEASDAVVLNGVEIGAPHSPVSDTPPDDATQPAWPPTTTAPGSVDLSGHWLSTEGLSYVLEQDGDTVEFAEVNPLLGVVTASGSGTLRGRVFELSYQTTLGAAGRGRFTVAGDGQSMSGSYTDLSTGGSQQATLIRQQD